MALCCIEDFTFRTHLSVAEIFGKTSDGGLIHNRKVAF